MNESHESTKWIWMFSIVLNGLLLFMGILAGVVQLIFLSLALLAWSIFAWVKNDQYEQAEKDAKRECVQRPIPDNIHPKNG